jgi:hypothetical protein
LKCHDTPRYPQLLWFARFPGRSGIERQETVWVWALSHLKQALRRALFSAVCMTVSSQRSISPKDA